MTDSPGDRTRACRGRNWLPLSAAVIPAILLASCGGDEPSGNAPPAAAAPTFTSPTAVSVNENASGVVYTATATDANGDPLTFSITGGADAARFTITTGGALSFSAAPDFEMPDDAGSDNTYNLQISVSDGSAQISQPLTVTIVNVGPDDFALRRVGSGFAQPVFLTGLPDGTGRVLVVERAGVIRILDPDTGTVAAAPFLDVSADVIALAEFGLLGLALAPDFATTGIYYVHLNTPLGDTEIRRYRASGGTTDAATGDVLFQLRQPAGNHNGGWIGFGPDGYLYIPLGDGGGPGSPANGQDITTLLGAILRIDVSSDDFPGDPLRDYAIPSDNPFVGKSGADEIFAFGFRNPFRAAFDSQTGNLLVGDVGELRIEEIDLVRPQDAGGNYGWDAFEGTLSYNGTAVSPTIAPVAQYPHDNTERGGRSVTGGVVYRGPIEALSGHYIFGDFVSNNIWSIRARDFSQGRTIAPSAFMLHNAQFAPNAGSRANISNFGLDSDGDLYVVSIGGDIFRVEIR